MPDVVVPVVRGDDLAGRLVGKQFAEARGGVGAVPSGPVTGEDDPAVALAGDRDRRALRDELPDCRDDVRAADLADRLLERIEDAKRSAA